MHLITHVLCMYQFVYGLKMSFPYILFYINSDKTIPPKQQEEKMLINREQRETLNELFEKLKLNNKSGKDKDAKIEQIVAYLEVIHSFVRKYSPKRKLIFIESCAGNCYLSMLISYYYKHIDPRNIEIHCIDINRSLMEKAALTAENFDLNMHFYSADVMDFETDTDAHIVYSLHACDTATDKTLYIGVKTNAKLVLSVSCCQHTIAKKFKQKNLRSITKHSIFKDKFVYMLGDSMRSLLMEKKGYKTNIFEFVSSRYTDKNVMLRAQKSNIFVDQQIPDEYSQLYSQFKVKPVLDEYLQMLL